MVSASRRDIFCCNCTLTTCFANVRAALTITAEIAAAASESAMSFSGSSPSKKAYFALTVAVCDDMVVSGPSGCLRDSTAWTPLFVRTHEPSDGDVAVGLVLFVLVYYVLVTRAVQVVTVLGLCVPASGLLVGLKANDRLFQLPMACLIVCGLTSSYETPFAILYGVYVFTGIGVAAASFKCDHFAFAIIDGAGLFLCMCTLVWVSKRGSVARLAAAGELLACILIVATDLSVIKEREQHLTWWGVVAYGVYLWARARQQQDSVWLTVLLLHIVIITGVWFMSLSRCDLLQDALNEAGPGLYLVGNFILHYYPFLRLISYSPGHLVRPLRQVTVTIAIIVAYASTTSARQVYGCQSWLSPLVVVTSFAGVVALGFSSLIWFGSWALFPAKL